MPNYNKSFNFRNGVQVDEDDLIVRSSLVGIGTTIPTSELDVYGDTRVTGIVTTNKLYVSGVSTYVGDVNIGAGITISASTGIISATKLYGDGSGLSDLPTSQWVDVDPGIGFTSIYAQGRVGIGTTNPSGFTLQIGGPDDGSPGVGINTTGNIRATGIVTAARFVGTGITAVSDFKVGANATVGITTILDEDDLGSNSATALVTQQSVKAYIDAQVTAQDVDIATDSGTVDIDLDSETLTIAGTSKEIETSGSGTTVTIGLPNTIEISKDLKVAGIGTVVNLDTTYANVSGVTTSRSINATYLNVSAASTLGVTTFTNQVSLKHLDVSGISTFGGKLVLQSPVDANETLDVDGQAELDDVNISGVSTFVGLGTFKGGLKVSGGDGFVATTAKIGDLTDNRIVIAGTAGELEDNANLTFDGYTLKVGSGVTISSDHLDITGVTTSTKIKSGTVQIGYGGGNEIDTSAGNLTIDSAGGTVTVDDNLTVAGITTGQSTFAKNISVSGVTTSTQFRSGTVRVTNNKVDTISGNLSLGAALGTVDIDNNLSVTGFATVTQALLPDTDKGATVGSATKAFTSAHVNEVRIGAGATNEIDTRGGNLVLDAASNVVHVDSNLTVVNGTVLTGIATIGNSLVPDTDQGAVLGGVSARFSGLYVDNVRVGHTNDQTIDTASGDLKLNSATGKVEIPHLVVTGTVDHVGVSTVSTGLSPDIDKGAYLGQATKAFSEAHIDEIRIGVGATNEIDTREGNLILDAQSNIVEVDATLQANGVANLNGNVAAATNAFFVNASNKRVGVGTNLPSSEVEFVKDTGNMTVEVVSRDATSTIGLGQSIGIGNSSGTIVYDGENLKIDNRSDSGDIDVNLSSGSGINTSSYFNVKYKNMPVVSIGYSGGVGINKALPSKALDVVGDLNVSQDGNIAGILTIGTGANQVTFGNGSVALGLWGSVADGIHSVPSVGIGTTQPIDKLTVVGGVSVAGFVSATNYFGSGADLTNINYSNVINTPSEIWTSVLGGIHPSNISKSVGIGTTDPTKDLTVRGDQNITGALFVESGDVGIGTTVAHSDSRTVFLVEQSAILKGTLTATGNVGVTTNKITGINTTGLKVDHEIQAIGGVFGSGVGITTVRSNEIVLSQDSINTGSVSGIGFTFGKDISGTPSLDYGDFQQYGDAAFVGTGAGTTAIGSRVIFVPGVHDDSTVKNVVDYDRSGVGTAFWTQANVGINTYVPRSSLDLGASKGFLIPPIHDAATRLSLNPGADVGLGTQGTWVNPFIDKNTLDPRYSGDPNGQPIGRGKPLPGVVDGSLSFYDPKKRLEIGITSYSNFDTAGDEDWEPSTQVVTTGNAGITTNRITGISTYGIAVGQDVRYQSHPAGIAWNTKVSAIGSNEVTIDKLTLNSGAVTGVAYTFGYYNWTRTQRFYGIPTFGIAGEAEYFQPPKVTESTRETMVNLDDGDDFDGGPNQGAQGFGAIVYNKDSNRLEVFVPIAGGTGIGTWCGITTIA